MLVLELVTFFLFTQKFERHLALLKCFINITYIQYQISLEFYIKTMLFSERRAIHKTVTALKYGQILERFEGHFYKGRDKLSLVGIVSSEFHGSKGREVFKEELYFLSLWPVKSFK